MGEEIYSDEIMIAALKTTKGGVYLAAKAIGCAPTTIYDRAAKSPAVEECIKAQRGQVIDTAELKLYQAILDGQPWAIALALKTIGKHRGYVERSEVTGKDGATQPGLIVYLPAKESDEPAGTEPGSPTATETDGVPEKQG